MNLDHPTIAFLVLFSGLCLYGVRLWLRSALGLLRNDGLAQRAAELEQEMHNTDREIHLPPNA